jgi:acyl dehydratase
MDTGAPERLLAHPMFPVCFEWPVVIGMRQAFASGLTPAESRRGVHATHDVTIHRPIHPPAKLTTRATIVAIEQRKPGAFQLTKLETTDESGALVCASMYGTIYRGVEVIGENKSLAPNAELPRPKEMPRRPVSESKVHVAAGLAHIYTECAQIWNPIHTDIAVAKAAGLPELILHGTATLALAVSRIVGSEAGEDPSRVARIAGRFSGMVLMPSDITVRVLAREAYENGNLVHFDVLTQSGEPAISHGAILLHR